MKSIDLKEGLITVGDSSVSTYWRWVLLPKVVDAECKDIKLTDIKAGDVLYIYTDKSDALPGEGAKVTLIQKVQ